MADIDPETDGLVSTGWLEKNIHDERVRVVDATWYLPAQGKDGREEYQKEHIPGAVFWDIDYIADQSDPLPHMLPDEATFASRMEGLGIGNDTFVVVYDAHGLMTAARAWWMLRAFGHDGVAVLDGGLPKWRAGDLPINAVPPVHRPVSFTAKLRPGLVCNKNQVLENIASGAAQTIDARSAGRFKGTEPEPREGMRSGHIPKSLNLPFTDLIDPGDKTLLGTEAIRKAVAAAGIDPARPTITSCGSGVTACVVALGLYRLGNRDIAVYDGSWSEWGRPGDLPVEI